MLGVNGEKKTLQNEQLFYAFIIFSYATLLTFHDSFNDNF